MCFIDLYFVVFFSDRNGGVDHKIQKLAHVGYPRHSRRCAGDVVVKIFFSDNVGYCITAAVKVSIFKLFSLCVDEAPFCSALHFAGAKQMRNGFGGHGFGAGYAIILEVIYDEMCAEISIRLTDDVGAGNSSFLAGGRAVGNSCHILMFSLI